MTFDTTTPSTEGREAAVPCTVKPPPNMASPPAPMHPRPIRAEEWAELLRGTGIVLGPRLAEAARVIRVIVRHYAAPSSTRHAAGGGAASAAPLIIEPPPNTASPPAPGYPRPIRAEEWAELLRGTGIVLGPRLAEAARVIRVIARHYPAASRAHNQSSGSYAAIEGRSRLLHTADYGTVQWRQEEYYLTPLQAKVVRVLHAEQRKGFRELRGIRPSCGGRCV